MERDERIFSIIFDSNLEACFKLKKEPPNKIDVEIIGLSCNTK